MTQITDTKCKLGLAHVEREGRPGEGLAEQVAAQEGGGAARPRRLVPARPAATRISSASARYSSGMARVHLANCRATDLVSTYPSASAVSST